MPTLDDLVARLTAARDVERDARSTYLRTESDDDHAALSAATYKRQLAESVLEAGLRLTKEQRGGRRMAQGGGGAGGDGEAAAARRRGDQ